MFKSQQEFERIAMPEAPRLLRFARRLTGNIPAAEDLVQETCSGVAQFSSVAARHQRTRVVVRILVNGFYGQGRKFRALPAMVPLECRIPARAGSSKIDRLEMAQALDSLPVDHRAVLLLAIVEGFTCREVSEILSVPIGTVMSRLSRARQSLRERLTHSEKANR